MFYVYELLEDIQEGITDLRQAGKQFRGIKAFENFLEKKERDYIEFKEICCRFGRNNSLPDLVEYLKERTSDPGSNYYKKYKYLGICDKGSQYFRMTKKVIKEINAEIEKNPQLKLW